MILDELSQLTALSLGMLPLVKTRKAAVNTRQNRDALFAACREADSAALDAALSMGMDVNVRGDKGWTRGKSPLWACSHIGWADGIRELLARGADEAKIDGYFKQPRNGRANETCLEMSAAYGHGDAFRLLYPLHSAEEQAKALAAARGPSTYLACEALGLADRIDPALAREILSSCLPALDPATRKDPQQRSMELAAFDAVAARHGLRDDQAWRESLVLEALGNDSPSLIQALAKRSIGPDDEGRLEIVPSEVLWPSHAPARMTTTRPGGSPSFTKQASTPLRKEAMGTELGLHLLARKASTKLMRRLADLGEDLALVVDDAGRNHLHRAAANAGSKTDLEDLAKLCPAWINQRDSQGLLPIDLVDPQRRPSMSVLFDKVGMRDALSGKRGKRTPPAAKRRL